MQFTVTLFLLVFTSTTFAKTDIDKQQTLNDVRLKSGKTDAVRTFVGSMEKAFPFPLELVKKGITNFTDKCNNSYKGKRKYTEAESDCKYHNENLVETFVVKDLRNKPSFQNVTEVYLLGRRVYNRGSFGYYELVTISEKLNSKKQKVVTITSKMLKDKEVKLFTEPKFSRETAFDSSTSTYQLTELSPNETHLNYKYHAETDHWLLNKEVSVPQVFASISRSINALMKTVETESSNQKRELASKE